MGTKVEPGLSCKRSYAAYKGHFKRALQSFESVLKIQPAPTLQSLEKSYARVQKQADSLLNASDKLISTIESSETAEEDDTQKELSDLTTEYEKLISDQCLIETRYLEFKKRYADTSQPPPTTAPSQAPVSTTYIPDSSRPSVRLTALEPPSWNGVRADFYTWQKKFIHIMDEAKVMDELTQLCYLQNSKTLPSEYQILITDCSNMNEVWGRLEERVPREVIKYEIIAQFRSLKPISYKKTPSTLRNFANEVSLFCRRMSDLGFEKQHYSCIILQDVYEKLDHDTTMRYRSKLELKRELSSPRTKESGDCDENLESLCSFIRSEATTLELTTGLSFPEKSVKRLLSTNEPSLSRSRSNTDPDPRTNTYKCILGCNNPHRLIDCGLYMNWPVSKRHEFIKTSSRCSVCLVSYHSSQNCNKKDLKCKYCSGNSHHWTLCENNPTNTTKSTNPFDKIDKSGKNSPIYSSAVSHYGVNPKDFAPIVVAEIKSGNGQWINANCFLDTGSNTSLIRSNFAKQAKLYSNGISDVQFEVAGGGVHHERAEQFEIQIRAKGTKEEYLILTTGIKKPCSTVQPISSDLIGNYDHLQEYKDKIHTNGGVIDLLIGNDYAPLITAEKCVSARFEPDKHPSIACTRIGCYIYGGLLNEPTESVNNVVSINHIDMREINNLETFFYGDVIGVKPTTLCTCSDVEIAESAFIKHVRATTTINDDGRICVKMPWKPGYPDDLPNNYKFAEEQMIRR